MKLKPILMLVAKAAVAYTITSVVVDKLAAKLPDKMVVGGKDIRPYITGTGVMAILMWAGSKNKLGPVGDVVKPAA